MERWGARFKNLEVPSEYPNRPEVAGRARGGGGMGNGSAFVGASQWVLVTHSTRLRNRQIHSQKAGDLYV